MAAISDTKAKRRSMRRVLGSRAERRTIRKLWRTCRAAPFGSRLGEGQSVLACALWLGRNAFGGLLLCWIERGCNARRCREAPGRVVDHHIARRESRTGWRREANGRPNHEVAADRAAGAFR